MITLLYAPLHAYPFFTFYRLVSLCASDSVGFIFSALFSYLTFFSFSLAFLVHIISLWCSPVLPKMRRVVLCAHFPPAPVLVRYGNYFSAKLLARFAFLLYHRLDPSIPSATVLPCALSTPFRTSFPFSFFQSSHSLLSSFFSLPSGSPLWVLACKALNS
ncbi:hypothetical protein HOY80DRAFT_430483 [Tuber brumale]|nr:hypothetical protein HOY80DRAFT_430483 [Tuber brumale]